MVDSSIDQWEKDEMLKDSAKTGEKPSWKEFLKGE